MEFQRIQKVFILFLFIYSLNIFFFSPFSYSLLFSLYFSSFHLSPFIQIFILQKYIFCFTVVHLRFDSINFPSLCKGDPHQAMNICE